MLLSVAMMVVEMEVVTVTMMVLLKLMNQSLQLIEVFQLMLTVE